MITAIGKAEGTATITVTARDSDGNSVSDAFDVTVPAAAQQQQAVELPGPVTGLTGTDGLQERTASRFPGSAPATGGAPDGYIVHLKPEDGEKGSGKTKRPKAKKTQVKFNKLQSGQTYQVWVRERRTRPARANGSTPPSPCRSRETARRVNNPPGGAG